MTQHGISHNFFQKRLHTYIEIKQVQKICVPKFPQPKPKKYKSTTLHKHGFGINATQVSPLQILTRAIRVLSNPTVLPELTTSVRTISEKGRTQNIALNTLTIQTPHSPEPVHQPQGLYTYSTSTSLWNINHHGHSTWRTTRECENSGRILKGEYMWKFTISRGTFK